MAVFKQGDLVTIINPISLPDGTELPHPVLIISSNRCNSYENHYTGVMMSATSTKDRFSFMCDDSMFESKLEKNDCQLRTYILVAFHEKDIKKFKNRMIGVHLKALLNEIKNLIFIID